MKLSTTLYVPSTFSCTGTDSPITNRLIRSIRRKHAIANGVVSSAKRPLVNMSMLIGNAAINAVASFSNGCSLRIPSNGRVLIVSCVKCGARSVAMKGDGRLGVGVRTSARTLSRIIIINCNIVGGHSLANSVTSIGTTSVMGSPTSGTVRTLRKRIPNLSVMHGSNGTASNMAVGVHKRHSLSSIGSRFNGGITGTPLFVVSNVRKNSFSSVTPTSVRSVRILGSTSSATVCNSRNTGKMVVVAAGGNTRNGAGFSCGNCFNIGN